MDGVFFLLSKLALGVLAPLNFMVLLTLAGVLLAWRGWRIGRWLAGTGFALLLAVMAYPVGDWLIQPLETRFATPHPMPDDIDGIILLGGGEQLGRSLSWHRPLTGEAGERYMDAAWLARQYRDVPVIFSGGSGSVLLQNDGKEGDIAAALLIQLGVPSERIIIERSSRNTWENFRHLKPILKANGKYLLVTSAYHMPRSVGIARRLGIHVVPWPTDYRSYRGHYRKLDFDFHDHMKSLQPAVKEWIGLTVYYLTGKTDSWLPGPQEPERLP